MDPYHARQLLLQLSAEHGFWPARIATLRETPRGPAYQAWLASGFHGSMDWMATSAPLRLDPDRRKPGHFRSVLVMALRYDTEVPPDPGGLTGRVARYAWGRDYHNLMGKRLRKLQRSLNEAGIDSWGGVDSAPIVERAWAAVSGLGFTGKSTLQILPGSTSYFFLATLCVSVDALPDEPITRDHCGRCRRCLAACPTDAFPQAYVLDARRCIAYWTIEARDVAPPSLRPKFGRWFFGCDVCQEVCPHNHHPPPGEEPDLRPKNAWIDLVEVLETSDEALMERFLGTPLRRPGAAGLKRNAALVLGNLGDPSAGGPLRRWGLTHPAPPVREAAEWALQALDRGPSPGGTETDGGACGAPALPR